MNEHHKIVIVNLTFFTVFDRIIAQKKFLNFVKIGEKGAN